MNNNELKNKIYKYSNEYKKMCEQISKNSRKSNIYPIFFLLFLLIPLPIVKYIVYLLAIALVFNYLNTINIYFKSEKKIKQINNYIKDIYSNVEEKNSKQVKYSKVNTNKNFFIKEKIQKLKYLCINSNPKAVRRTLSFQRLVLQIPIFLILLLINSIVNNLLTMILSVYSGVSLFYVGIFDVIEDSINYRKKILEEDLKLIKQNENNNEKNDENLINHSISKSNTNSKINNYKYHYSAQKTIFQIESLINQKNQTVTKKKKKIK